MLFLLWSWLGLRCDAKTIDWWHYEQHGWEELRTERPVTKVQGSLILTYTDWCRACSSFRSFVGWFGLQILMNTLWSAAEIGLRTSISAYLPMQRLIRVRQWNEKERSIRLRKLTNTYTMEQGETRKEEFVHVTPTHPATNILSASTLWDFQLDTRQSLPTQTIHPCDLSQCC